MNLRLGRTVLGFVVWALVYGRGDAQEAAGKRSSKKPAITSALTFPPTLPEGKSFISDRSEKFLIAPTNLRDDVAIAKTPPQVDFVFYPGQTYEGKPWSNWGDGLAVHGIYYSSIGDHLAIGEKGDGQHGTGTAHVYEYDAETKSLRHLVDVARLLNLPAGHYTPGKIHTRIDSGSDGWLYFATHRGSIRATTQANHYQGDWILRVHPGTGQSEVVVQAPVPEHAIPNGLLDPDRLIYYGGTAAGVESDVPGIQFFAYDVKSRKLLFAGPDGPARYLILARSTGRVYYVAGNEEGPLRRFDPARPAAPQDIPGTRLGVRSATDETVDGHVFTVSTGQRSQDATIWSFHTKSEQVRQIGTAAVGTQAYVASIDADPTGRFLYYVPGAHGGSEMDGTPVVQFDVQSGKKKVIAFLEPYFTDTYGFTLKGTYSTALDPQGDKLYITWNVSRGGRAWDCCGLTVVHIPESER